MTLPYSTMCGEATIDIEKLFEFICESEGISPQTFILNQKMKFLKERGYLSEVIPKNIEKMPKYYCKVENAFRIRITVDGKERGYGSYPYSEYTENEVANIVQFIRVLDTHEKINISNASINKKGEEYREFLLEYMLKSNYDYIKGEWL